MGVLLRPRRPEDLVACAQALNAVHELDGYPVRWPADPSAWLTAAGTLVAVVGELDGEVVAHGLIRWAEGTEAADSLVRASGRRIEEIAMVSRLFVAPAGRRRGIGRQLLDALVSAAAEHGVVLGLDVVDKDEAAIAMYERAGWRRVATLPCDWAPDRLLHCYLAPHSLSGDHEDFESP